MSDRSQLFSLVSEVGEALKSHEKMIVTAESCTGGLIAEALTSIAGSTAWFDRAYVTYSYEAKREMLGVKETTIMKKGAVSQECVEEMVLGALQQSHAKVAVACSGIAGPGGGTPDKPVGTVWISWAIQGHDKLISKEFHFDGDRDAVRSQCTVEALKGVLDLLNE
ncbi:CinA family protein [Hydrogenovibrio sp. JE_KL2]|jgi:competence/damage-inducible protein CinA C-terminal domain|uniref:CinA family protein n=1 Tax=Hydrogenovibrio sp. JE_KL2 TaxID=2651188 RepID=UPI00128DEB33|nr:CinA family protein [Hydrogenovibrio sp. JE_KL2]MBD3821368.1 CinA family protein [Thiotrichales bacterium]MBN2606673.1 CinA family protein [Thiotrichales bacterium]MPQ76880.1 CinA family protein [Hydrogenovibrio sp. JE_KL2]